MPIGDQQGFNLFARHADLNFSSCEGGTEGFVEYPVEYYMFLHAIGGSTSLGNEYDMCSVAYTVWGLSYCDDLDGQSTSLIVNSAKWIGPV